MVPPTLKRFSNEIVALNPSSQAIKYYKATWERWIGDNHAFQQVARRFPEKIRRSDLRTLAAEAIVDKQSFLHVFIAAMVYGYGTGGRLYRTQEMLEGLKNDPTMLRETADSLLRYDFVGAHRRFRLRMCGAPFFSKYFYAIGLGAQLAPLPLILDSRVEASLVRLHNLGEIDQYRYWTRSAWTADGYANFIHDMNSWANELSCTPDSLEMFLFSPPQAF